MSFEYLELIFNILSIDFVHSFPKADANYL